MSIQDPDRGPIVSPPIFSTKKDDLESTQNKPLGDVYYSDEHTPLISHSTSSLTNGLVVTVMIAYLSQST